MNGTTLGTLILVAAAAVVGVGSTADAAELCTSCADCEAKLASGLYTTVQLNADIIDHEGTCIRLDQPGGGDVNFDCAGHLIDGDGQSTEPVRGIALLHGNGYTVTNCVLTDFTSAIYLVEATNSWVIGNVMHDNNIGVDLSNSSGNTIVGNTVRGASSGIKLSNSDSNLLESNTFCDNFPWDIYFASGLYNVGYENTCSVTYYWNDDGASDCTYTCGIFSSDFEDGGFGDWYVVSD